MSVARLAETDAAVTVADRYHHLRVKQVVAETATAVSIVFDLPQSVAVAFAYRAGQFVTLQVGVRKGANGRVVLGVRTG